MGSDLRAVWYTRQEIILTWCHSCPLMHPAEETVVLTGKAHLLKMEHSLSEQRLWRGRAQPLPWFTSLFPVIVCVIFVKCTPEIWFQCFLCGSSGGPNLSHLMVKSKFLLDTIGCFLRMIFWGFCTLPHCFLQSFKTVYVTLRAPSTFFTLPQRSSFAFLPALLHNLSLAASFTVIVS